MKKIIFVGITVLTFGVSSAQEVNFGVKGGLNVSTLTGDVEEVDAKIGFHVGGFAEIKLSDKFAFQPELLFSTQGAKSEYSESDGTDSYSEKFTLNLNYLNVPLMAKYFATDKLFIEAGPQIGLLLSAKTDYEYTETFQGVTFSESIDGVDVKDDFKSIDFGLNFGLGYEFTENIFAGARYNLGLSNIGEDTGDDKINNGVIQVSLGYKF